VSDTSVSEASVRTLPPPLAELVEDFAAVGPKDRLELLLELSRELPGLPERYAGERAGMEQVHECQSPLFLAVEVERGGADGEGADGEGADSAATVHLFFDAPPEAPTTRGFAGILAQGLDNRSAGEVLAVPDDFYVRLGLGEAVSPLRLRGMAAMLARIKRQVRLQLPG
jgi:cysteine desulfuration protein SufE